jgi:hypothetical protein
MIDLAWQLTAAASVVAAIPVGLALRRGIDKLDQQREQRRRAAHR